MPVCASHPRLIQSHTPFRRSSAMSAGRSAVTRLWKMLSWVHISVEITGRSARAFSRADWMSLTIEVGFCRSMR